MDDVRSAVGERPPPAVFLGGWLRWRGVRWSLRPHRADSGLRQDHPRRAFRLPRFGATGGDSRRAGLPGQRRCEYFFSRRRRWARFLVVLPARAKPGPIRAGLAVLLAGALSALDLSGCRQSASPEPGVLFESIYRDSLHGSLDAAEGRAENA